MPELTYVPRTERDLERRLAEVQDNLCKLVVVTGATKTGKTVLVKKVLSSAGQMVWIDGGLVDSEDDFWGGCIEKLSEFYESERLEETGSVDTTGTSGGASVSLGPLSGSIGGQSKVETSNKAIIKKERSGNLRSQSLRMMEEMGAILVIDDFHYLRRELQGGIIRALKGAVFNGFPAILIAIPHRRYDAVRVEREMNGRIEPIKVPEWTLEELVEIPLKGFPLLGMSISKELSTRLAQEAYGSPHLVQEFCKEIARRVSDSQSNDVDSGFSDDVFKVIAEHTGKIIFDKLASGPRARTDRLQRSLADGGTADIYRVVLMALSRLAPGMNKIDYEVLRSSIRDVLSGDIPQAHEVTRVLEKMAEIASKDEMSVKVLDWDDEEQKLHITDPFFAFFLKWAKDYVRGA